MSNFLVTVCPQVRMIDGRKSQGDYYQIRVEAQDKNEATRKAREHFSQNRRANEIGATFKVYAQ